MPAFILLIIIAAIALWFVCSFLYKPLGNIVGKIIKKSQDTIQESKEFKREKGESKDEE